MAFPGEALWIRLLYPKHVLSCVVFPYRVTCCMAWPWQGHVCKKNKYIYIYIKVKQIQINYPLRFSLPLHSSPWILSTENNNDTKLMLMGSHWAVGNLLEEKIWKMLHVQNAVEHITLCRDLWSLVEISWGHFNPTRSTWACGPGLLWLVYMQAVGRLRISWEYQELYSYQDCCPLGPFVNGSVVEGWCNKKTSRIWTEHNYW